MQQAAARRNRKDSERICHRLGGQRSALKRVEGNVDCWTITCADLFTDIQHRRFITFALTDDDSSLEVDRVEGPPHGIDRRLVSGLLIASANHFVSRNCSDLGDANHCVGKVRYQNTIRHLSSYSAMQSAGPSSQLKPRSP